MTNKSSKRLFYFVFITIGMVVVSKILEAKGISNASGSIEIMAKSISNATDTAVASGSAMLDQLLGSNGKFLLATLGGGGIAGWTVGYTCKKVAKIVAIFLGVTFITLQFLAYKHIITVDWTKVQNAMDKKYLEQSANSMMSVLTYNLPFAGSFVVGFLLGFKKG